MPAADTRSTSRRRAFPNRSGVRRTSRRIHRADGVRIRRENPGRSGPDQTPRWQANQRARAALRGAFGKALRALPLFRDDRRQTGQIRDSTLRARSCQFAGRPSSASVVGDRSAARPAPSDTLLSTPAATTAATMPVRISTKSETPERRNVAPPRVLHRSRTAPGRYSAFWEKTPADRRPEQPFGYVARNTKNGSAASKSRLSALNVIQHVSARRRRSSSPPPPPRSSRSRDAAARPGDVLHVLRRHVAAAPRNAMCPRPPA